MLLKVIPLVFICARLCNAIQYDRFEGTVATEEQLAKYEELGVTSTCTKDIEACDATERRRVDGSCNHLEHPMRGTFFEPLRRVLPAHFVNSSELKLPRAIRTLLLWEGKSSHAQFTQGIPAYAIFGFGDIGSVHDIKYFLQNKTDCCTEEGMASSECSPNIIPEDDPVHRFSGIRCMNLTTPLTYSDFGCTNKTNHPIEQATGVYDMSPIYNAADKGDSVIRSYEGGKLTVDIDEDGIIWPPNGDNFCMANQPGETRCFGHHSNTLLSVMLLTVWYFRQHNHFAEELAAVNPSWDDETLFQNAREINIAFHAQVYHYEWLKSLIGEEYLIKEGVLSNCSGFRDVYDNTTYPVVSLEFTYILRWFHLMQEGSAFKYDIDGSFMNEYPYANFTFRPGYLGVDKNIVYFSQHIFRQKCAGIRGVDPDISENGLPYIQHSTDIVTSDLHKARLLNIAPYIDYVYLCTGHNITEFDDLELVMDEEHVDLVKRAFDKPSDIDLMSGLWLEDVIEGGSVPATLACLMTEHLSRTIKSDRHWYERANRPHAFTEDQLQEIRKSSLALLLCTTGDNITEVQPKAFNAISSDNALTACSNIPSIDFTMWADTTTNSTTSEDSTTSGSSSSSSASSSIDDSSSSSSTSSNSTATTSDTSS